MGNSMKKFKKLAALAITIPTLLSSTNISFAMKSNRQQSAFSPSLSDNYEIIYSSQSQEEDIYTSSKPIKPPAEDKKGKKSRIEEYLECTNPKCPTYRKGEKCVKPFGDPHTRIKDGKQMQQYKCKRCGQSFSQPINKNAEEQAGIETQPN